MKGVTGDKGFPGPSGPPGLSTKENRLITLVLSFMFFLHAPEKKQDIFGCNFKRHFDMFKINDLKTGKQKAQVIFFINFLESDLDMSKRLVEIRGKITSTLIPGTQRGWITILVSMLHWNSSGYGKRIQLHGLMFALLLLTVCIIFYELSGGKGTARSARQAGSSRPTRSTWTQGRTFKENKNSCL